MYEKLKFPASSMIVTKEMVKIAQSDVVPTAEIDEMLWYFPESEAFSTSFAAAGYGSRLLLENIGLTIYLVVLNMMLGVLHFLLLPCAKLCTFGSKVVKKMESYLYFNGTLRFYTEIFFDIVVVASINLEAADWETPFWSEEMSNFISAFLIGITGFCPFIAIIVIFKSPSLW